MHKEKAFLKTMGALNMPPDESPEYDRWLFDEAWGAAIRAAIEEISGEQYGHDPAEVCERIMDCLQQLL